MPGGTLPDGMHHRRFRGGRKKGRRSGGRSAGIRAAPSPGHDRCPYPLRKRLPNMFLPPPPRAPVMGGSRAAPARGECRRDRPARAREAGVPAPAPRPPPPGPGRAPAPPRAPGASRSGSSARIGAIGVAARRDRHPARRQARGARPRASGRTSRRSGYRAGCTGSDRIGPASAPRPVAGQEGRAAGQAQHGRRWRARARRRPAPGPPPPRTRPGTRPARPAAGSPCRCRDRGSAPGAGNRRRPPGRVDQGFRVRARDQGDRGDREIEAPELPPAEDQRQRLARRAAGDQRLVAAVPRPARPDRRAGRPGRGPAHGRAAAAHRAGASSTPAAARRSAPQASAARRVAAAHPSAARRAAWSSAVSASMNSSSSPAITRSIL